MLRRQVPVHSPLTWGALTAGFGAALGGNAAGLRGRLTDLLRARYGARDALLVDSGTSALRLAIAAALGEGGRPVALPGYTCYDMASAAEGAGARVALYDVDPATLGPDPASLDAVVSGVEPAAVVVGHLFGHLVDVPRFEESVGDALLIEDAAQGVGGSISGRPLGSFGSLAVLSFGRGKGLTGGGGGALLAHDERGQAGLDRVRALVPERSGRGARQLVALAAQHVLGRPSLYGIPASLPFLHLGETVYHPPSPPTPTTVASLAVLERVLDPANAARAIRSRHAARLLRALEGSERLRPPSPVPHGAPGYLRLPALVRRTDRARLLGPTAARLGVAAGYPTTLAALPSLAPHLLEPAPDLPGSSELAEGLLTLPTHALLAERDLRSLERWITAPTA